ncbi:hypothetical protein [Candidatus Hodarchaeum mangrovi]
MTGAIKLSKYEKKFIELYGDLFTLRERSKNFGRIFSLLILKATEENHGLTQDQIVECLIKNGLVPNISQSTVSRTLKQLRKNQYCQSVGHNVREKQKYFTKKSFHDLAFDLIQRNIVDGKKVIISMNDLKNEIPDELKDQSETQNLLFKIEDIVDYFEFITQVYLDLLEKNKDRFKSS